MKIEKLSTRIGDESDEKINISLIIELTPAKSIHRLETRVMKKLILVLLFLLINIGVFSIQSKKNLVRVDIIGKSGVKSYYVNFSNEQNLDSFEIYDTSD